MSVAVSPDNALRINSRLTIPSDEVDIRTTTSSGPGGQHANRSATRVIATFRVNESEHLTRRQREVLLKNVGPLVRVSSSRQRSQAQNKSAALLGLAQKIADGLHEPKVRIATKKSKSSQERRLASKQRRSDVKQQRRRKMDD